MAANFCSPSNSLCEVFMGFVILFMIPINYALSFTLHIVTKQTTVVVIQSSNPSNGFVKSDQPDCRHSSMVDFNSQGGSHAR